MEYDGVAEYLVADPCVIQRAFEDPLFREKVQLDENNFMDMKKAVWTAGWEEVYVRDNKIVPDSEARQNAL